MRKSDSFLFLNGFLKYLLALFRLYDRKSEGGRPARNVPPGLRPQTGDSDYVYTVMFHYYSEYDNILKQHILK